MYLSKSKYTQGIQCPKMLWMQKNMPEQFDCSVMNNEILKTGNKVGDRAMGYKLRPYLSRHGVHSFRTIDCIAYRLREGHRATHIRESNATD